MNLYEKPIPEFDGFKWEEVKKIEIKESGEELVPLSLIPEKILVSPQYYIQNIEGALPECYIREGNLNRLLRVSEKLPEGYKLLIFDAWRPEQVQISLFDRYYQELRKKMPYKNKEDLIKLTKEFIALPSTDPSSPSPHITGGAVDLTIVDDRGKMLNMGTGFDETDDRTHTRYFEILLKKGKKLTEEEEEILKNRRLLYHLMSEEGFTNYPSEWWHFDYGNQNWAWMKQDDRPAIYGAISPDFRWDSFGFNNLKKEIKSL